MAARLCVLAALAVLVTADKVPVFRLAHFDSKLLAHGAVVEADDSAGSDGDVQDLASFRETSQYGSRQAAVQLSAAAAHKADDGKTNKEDLLNRKVAVVKLVDVDYTRFVTLLRSRRAAALLVLLPTAADLAKVRVLDSRLLQGGPACSTRGSVSVDCRCYVVSLLCRRGRGVLASGTSARLAVSTWQDGVARLMLSSSCRPRCRVVVTVVASVSPAPCI